MLIMAERVNHPPHYNAGGIECIDALEAATSGLQGIEAFCTANAIKYLWRWKLKNGEEDLQKAVWYINRLIQRAGADSAAGKELFNMKENKHGFEPKQEFTMGGIAWTVIQTGADWVKCIASDCVEERAFDEGNKNDFAACALPGFVDSKNEEKTERNAGYLVVSHSGGGMLRQGTRKGIRRTPANRGMRAHWVVKGLDISEDVCHGMCP